MRIYSLTRRLNWSPLPIFHIFFCVTNELRYIESHNFWKMYEYRMGLRKFCFLRFFPLAANILVYRYENSIFEGVRESSCYLSLFLSVRLLVFSRAPVIRLACSRFWIIVQTLVAHSEVKYSFTSRCSSEGYSTKQAIKEHRIKEERPEGMWKIRNSSAVRS